MGATNYSEQAFYLEGATATPGSGVQYISMSMPLTANLTLKSTTSSTTGVIMKDTVRFLHDFTGTGATGQNIFLGLYSGNFTMAGTTHQASYNTGVGRYTLNALTTGSYNVAVGNNTLRYNDSGTSNVALGHSTLTANTSGAGNVAVGASALVANTTGGGSIAIGYYAGAYVTTTGNELFVNNQDRTNVAGDRGKSLIYGIMDASVANQVLSINGKVAINLSNTYATPSYELSMSGVSAKTVGMERNTTSNTAGQNLTILAGGATSGATDKAGGSLILSGGTATGSATSEIQLWTTTAGGAGTTDRAPTLKWVFNGAGTLYPYSDNAYTIGDNSYRVNKIIVGTGTSLFGGDVGVTGKLTGKVNVVSKADSYDMAAVPVTAEKQRGMFLVTAASKTITLDTAAVGETISFVVDHSGNGFTVVIDPTPGTDRFVRLGSSYSSAVLANTAGTSMSITCLETGYWTVTGENGVITFS